MKKSVVWYKLRHWEFWPTFMFYLPNIPYAFYLALRAKHLTFFTATNPGIHNSGDGMESKYETIQLVPKGFRPKTVLVDIKTPFDVITKKIEEENIAYPLIVKPDVGFRGLLVKKICTPNELKEYVTRYPIKLIIQELITLPNECGIFYYRLPDEQEGKITSITLKEFSHIIGDGTSTINQLIQKNNRTNLYYDLLSNLNNHNLNTVLPKGEKFILNHIGNHCKGTRFVNGNHLISEQLTKTFDKINKQIDGWYFGRIDLKYNSWEELVNGNNFKILEINGIISEPTHIYDSENQSYFKALKELAKHWKIISKISTINHQILHFPYTKPKRFIKDMTALKKYVKRIKTLAS